MMSALRRPIEARCGIARGIARGTAICTALLVAACATYQGYEGPKRSSEDIAVVAGDAKLRAQMPVAIVIRAVDGRSVDLQYSSVALSPGKHELVVDCQVGGVDGSTSRHEVELDVAGGERYRLRAEMQPGNRACGRVVANRTR
jgi:hypothetical protein